MIVQELGIAARGLGDSRVQTSKPPVRRRPCRPSGSLSELASMPLWRWAFANDPLPDAPPRSPFSAAATPSALALAREFWPIFGQQNATPVQILPRGLRGAEKGSKMTKIRTHHYIPIIAVAMGLAGCQQNPPNPNPSTVVVQPNNPPPSPTTTEERKSTTETKQETKQANPNTESTTTKKSEETVEKKKQ